MKIAVKTPVEFAEFMRPKRLNPTRAIIKILRMLNRLDPGSTVTVKREEIEKPPRDGWRQFSFGNKIFIEIHPPPAAST